MGLFPASGPDVLRSPAGGTSHAGFVATQNAHGRRGEGPTRDWARVLGVFFRSRIPGGQCLGHGDADPLAGRRDFWFQSARRAITPGRESRRFSRASGVCTTKRIRCERSELPRCRGGLYSTAAPLTPDHEAQCASTYLPRNRRGRKVVLRQPGATATLELERRRTRTDHRISSPSEVENARLV
jgi:hypothetical protein